MRLNLDGLDVDYKPTKKFIDLAGKKFGKLTLTSFAGARKRPSSRWTHYYNCVCECGNKVIVQTGNLTRGTTRSCGCLRKGQMVRSKAKNKMSDWLASLKG